MRIKLLATVAAVSMGLAAGLAEAATLTIVNTSVGNQEHTGDPGGSAFPYTNGVAGPGPGVPWQSRNVAGGISGGWPTGPGMSPDTSFLPNWGASGWHGAYLAVSDQSAAITFQYMGQGDSALDNTFQVYNSGAWTNLFTQSTAPCGASGSAPVTPVCTAGVNQFTFTFLASDYATVGGNSYVPFRYITGNGVQLTNDGTNNPDDVGTSPGYFLGVDPYLASIAHQTSGQAVYAGLTDLPATGDHDYQDLGVRISVVPEPASLTLLGAGLVGLTLLRRRRAV